MRTVVYTRVSTDEQKKSFETQEAHYRRFCEMEGLNLVKVYADEGFTGTNTNREAFQSMLLDAGLKIIKLSGKNNSYDSTNKRPSFDLIVVKDVSRFARNSSEAGTIIKALREMNVHILFESNGINTKDIDNDMNLNFLLAMAESESKLNSKRQKFAYKSAMERDIYFGKAIPYGYMKDNDIDKSIIIDEEKAKVVRYVFERAKEVGSRMIARELNKKNIPTQKNKTWGTSQIQQMLANTLYYGSATVNKTNKLQLTSVPKRTKPEEQKLIPNAVEPIITKELWEEANIAFKGRTSISGFGAKQPSTEDVFYRKITCGNCGGNYGRNRSSRKNKNGTVKHYYNYYCLNKDKKSTCKSTTIAFNLLCRLIKQKEPSFDFEQGFGQTNMIILKAIEKAKAEQQNIINKYEKEISALELEMREITDKILKVSSEATIQRLEQIIDEHTQSVKELQLKISNLNVNTLDRLANKTENKHEEIKKISKKSITDEQKMKLTTDIKIYDDYISFRFDTPNYEEIIKEFNSLVDKGFIIEIMQWEQFVNEHHVYKSEELRKEYEENRFEVM